MIAGFEESLLPQLLRATLVLSMSGVILAMLIRAFRIRSSGIESVCWLMVLIQGFLLVGVSVPLPGAFLAWANAERDKATTTAQAVSDTDNRDSSETSPQHVGETFVDASASTQHALSASQLPVKIAEQNNGMTLHASFIVLIWLSGVGVILVTSTVRYLWFLRSLEMESPCSEWRQILDQSGGKGIRLFVTEKTGPCLGWAPGGWFIAVPHQQWELLSDVEQHSVFLHELAHWRRLDVFRLLLGHVAVALHWFNPLGWWALKRLELSTECACDDDVVQAVSHTDYANVLMRLGSVGHPASLVHVTGRGNLFTRVTRILNSDQDRQTMRRSFAVLSATTMLLAIGVLRFDTARSLVAAVEKDEGESSSERANQVAKTDVLMQQAIASIVARQGSDGSFHDNDGLTKYRKGSTALAVLTLLNAGVDKESESIKKGMEFLSRAEMGIHYEISLELEAWLEFGDRGRARAGKLVRELELGQQPNGLWGYQKSRIDYTDHSNSSYVIRALAKAHRNGIQVETTVWERAAKQLRSSQLENGAWGYSSRSSGDANGNMTASCLHSLSLCAECNPATEVEFKAAREKAMQWLTATFSVRTSPPNGTWHLAYLTSLTELMTTLKLEELGSHDVKEEIVNYLKATQRPDGTWSNRTTGTLIDTCFALQAYSNSIAKPRK